MLPKHWAGAGGGAEVSEQLAAKQAGHNSLLLILGEAGILPQLSPTTLR